MAGTQTRFPVAKQVADTVFSSSIFIKRYGNKIGEAIELLNEQGNEHIGRQLSKVISLVERAHQIAVETAEDLQELSR